jgi:hypothetical protein
VARKKVVIEVSGVGFQVSGKRKNATCWSEAEIPSEAKRQWAVKNNSVYVLKNSMPHAPCPEPCALCLVPQTSFAGKALEQGKPRLPLPLPGVLGW